MKDTAMLTIGDFARATHLNIKTLRYYHDAQLLIPAEVDPNSGYRYYDIDQIPTGQVIRRFRALGMPIEEVRAVLNANDLSERDQLIAKHLHRLEGELGRTQQAIRSLRDLLEHPVTDPAVEHRHFPPVTVAAVSATVRTADLAVWLQGALGELYATADAQGINIEAAGEAGGIYEAGFFEADGGEAIIYLPTVLAPIGRIQLLNLPTADFVCVTHSGPEEGIDRAYGALAAYVAQHALGIDGPMRELYTVNRHHTAEAKRWRTQIGWPVFLAGTRPHESRIKS
jgi:DNA-binding transcriptional MerR regulator